MNLTLQKRLAATIMNCSEKRVVFDPARLEDIKEAITKTDIRMLVGEGAIKQKPVAGVSKVRARKRKAQRRKGLRKGEGRRKGKKTARESKKQAWMKRIRAQRKFLASLKARKLIKPVVFKEFYTKSKGGFFRSINHIKLYIKERKLLARPVKIPTTAPKKAQTKPAKAKPKPKDGKEKR